MKKVKDILNSQTVARVVVVVAAILAIIATILVIIHPRNNTVVPHGDDDAAHTSVVVVAAGDTLSKLLVDQGFSNVDVLEIAKILKSDADITSLRADNDKIEFVRTDPDGPVDKIVIIPSPWRRVEITCDDAGKWLCSAQDIEPDRRAVYRAGEIRDGDSFYLAGDVREFQMEY